MLRASPRYRAPTWDQRSMNPYFLSLGALLGAAIAYDQLLAAHALAGGRTDRQPEHYLKRADWLADIGLRLADEENQ